MTREKYCTAFPLCIPSCSTGPPRLPTSLPLHLPSLYHFTGSGFSWFSGVSFVCSGSRTLVYNIGCHSLLVMVFRGSQVSGSLCLCIWLSYVSLGVGYLRSWSGVLLGSSGGKTIWGNLRRWRRNGWDGMWRDLEGQDVASRPFYCMPLYGPIIPLLALILVLENVLFVV